MRMSIDGGMHSGPTGHTASDFIPIHNPARRAARRSALAALAAGRVTSEALRRAHNYEHAKLEGHDPFHGDSVRSASMRAFLLHNHEDADTFAAVCNLRLGDSVRLGGGAMPVLDVVRVS